MRLALAGLLGLAVVLAGITAAELLLPGTEAVVPGPTIRRGAPPVPHVDPNAEAAEAQDHTDEWVETILARPLFTRDRKPVAAQGKATADAGADGPLPRLTGITVGPVGRQAIFSGAEGKAVVVIEGGTVGGYTVEAIAPGSVRLVGPDGARDLAPAFDPMPRAQTAADPGAGQGNAQPGQPGVPQFPQPGVPFQPGQPFQQGQPFQPGQQFPQPGFPNLPRPPGLQVPLPGRPRAGDAASHESGSLAFGPFAAAHAAPAGRPASPNAPVPPMMDAA